MIPIMTPLMSEPAKAITRDPQAFKYSEPHLDCGSGLFAFISRVVQFDN